MNERCPWCGGELVEVDNPLRREVRHRRGLEGLCPGPSTGTPGSSPGDVGAASNGPVVRDEGTDLPQAQLRLTNLGRLASLYSVQTNVNFWRAQFSDAAAIAEEDGDWEQMLKERAAGLAELLENLRSHGFDWYARNDEPAT